MGLRLQRLACELRTPKLLTTTSSHASLDERYAGPVPLAAKNRRLPGTATSTHHFTYAFVGAGTYPVVDRGTGSRGRVVVPMAASPASGSTATRFTITTAVARPAPGHAFETQVKRPGSNAFVTVWSRGTVHTFRPDAGPGTYEFRARMVRTSTGAHSGWSPTVAISVA